MLRPRGEKPHIPTKSSRAPAKKSSRLQQKKAVVTMTTAFEWAQRGMIPRPSDYESAALTD